MHGHGAMLKLLSCLNARDVQASWQAALEEHHASLAERVGYLEKAPCDKPAKSFFLRGFGGPGAGRRVGKRCLLLGVERPLLARVSLCVCVHPDSKLRVLAV